MSAFARLQRFARPCVGTGGFEEISGAKVNTILFCAERGGERTSIGSYIDVSAFAHKQAASMEAIRKGDWFRRAWSWFDVIPESPLAFWLAEDVRRLYREYPLLREIVTIKQGLATTDNPRFIRQYWEVPQRGRWVPLMMSEGEEKWYSNYSRRLDWELSGRRLKNIVIERYGSETKRVYSQEFYSSCGLNFWPIHRG